MTDRRHVRLELDGDRVVSFGLDPDQDRLRLEALERLVDACRYLRRLRGETPAAIRPVALNELCRVLADYEELIQ